MERVENIGFGGMKLIQEPHEFCYGIDAVLLADFAYSFNADFRLAVDLGTGTGIIPFILSHKNDKARFIGIDVQESTIGMARRSCAMNDLEPRMRFICDDVKNLNVNMWKEDNVDIVTCNPPYFPRGGGIPAGNKSRYIARHETTASVEDFIKAAAAALKGRGDFFLVHRPSRLVDIFYFCRKHLLEPKDVRFVVPEKGAAPNIVLVHCVAGGGRQLRIMENLWVYEENGAYNDEIERIYERK